MVAIFRSEQYVALGIGGARWLNYTLKTPGYLIYIRPLIDRCALCSRLGELSVLIGRPHP